MLKKVLLILGCLLLVTWLKGQCPDRQLLWREINFLKDTSTAQLQEIQETLQLRERQIQYCPYRYDSTHVLLLRAIAAIYHRQGNYLEAIKYFNQSVGLINRIANNPAVNASELVRIYYWLSESYKSVNNNTACVKALDNCVTMAERFNLIDRSVLSALYDMAEYFFDLGDYHRCIEYAMVCERNALKYATGEDKEAATGYVLSSFVWRINSLMQLQQYKTVDSLMDGWFKKTGINSMSNYDGTILGLRAEMEMRKGNYASSAGIFQQAIARERQPLARKQLFNSLANDIYFKHYKNYDKALSLSRKALTCINKDADLYKADSIESLNIWSNMAEVYAEQGRYDEAFRCFRRALDHIKPGISIAQIINSPLEDFIKQKKIHYLIGLLIAEGNAWRNKYTISQNPGDLRKSVQTFKEADQLVSRIREEQSNLHSKLFWRSNSHSLYEQALEACYTSHNIGDAFYFFEKSRAVLLNDQLTRQRWQGEQDIQQQTQVQKRMNTLSRTLQQNDLPEAKRSEIEAEIFTSQNALDKLTNTIKERNPFYYQNFIERDFVSLQQVKQRVLKEYQGLIELFSGDSAVYVMIITAGDARLRKIDKKAYDSLASLFIKYITNYDEQNEHFEVFTSISHHLYRLIFQQDNIPAGRLIISPDGQYFPFEALLTSNNPVSWLLKDHAISYTYSARYLLNDFTTVANKNVKSFMGFAPVEYSSTQLPALYESDRSLGALTGYFGTADNFVGKQASRSNFLRHFADYRIIQLYTHAMDNRDKGEPVIYFADSLLFLSDLISDKKPATSLVVLSACETGTGKFYQGEGVFSFNRGFAALGIPAAITSLWKADNKKTYALTTLFYKNLAKGEPVDVALQHAKLEFMELGPKENTLPYFWAVPVLTGKVTTMPGQPSTVLWILLPAIAISMILLALIYRWWRGKRATGPIQQRATVE